MSALINVPRALLRIITTPGCFVINWVQRMAAPDTPPLGPFLRAGVHGICTPMLIYVLGLIVTLPF